MLPKTLGEQDLHDLFSMYGELREVHVIRGPEGGAKGCAFVKFVEREAAVAAIENLNDTIPAVSENVQCVLQVLHTEVSSCFHF